MEKVSIIIPVYNGEKVISECVSSALSQSYENIEVICVNDGSRDTTPDILARIAERDNRLIIINKPNGGVSSARNAGLKAASGKYVQFLDSDDALSKNMTETMVSTFESSGAELVICGWRDSRSGAISAPEAGEYTVAQFKKQFLDICPKHFLNPPWNKLFLREKITACFNEKISLGEDMIFNMDYIDNISSVVMLDKGLYLYTTGQAHSLSGKYYRNGFEMAKKVSMRAVRFAEEKFSAEKLSSHLASTLSHYVIKEITASRKSKSEIKEILTAVAQDQFWQKHLYSVYRGNDDMVLKLARGKVSSLINGVKLSNTLRKLLKR